ncbi:tetratricopeptide repeat protein [Streptomyces sp. WG7]|uniref:tetratricopeptide repeat protein n=1 Tax=Streptomyces sp. WG7 TaxID=3417650 RepID=UPI003CF0409C
MDGESVDRPRREQAKASPGPGRAYGTQPFLLGYDSRPQPPLIVRLPHSGPRLKGARPETTDTDVRSRQITATLQMSLRAVQAADPAGLAVPALRLAALLDPAGHPDALWTQPSLLAHLSAYRSVPRGKNTSAGSSRVTADQARQILRLLHRHALLIHDPRDEPRAVRVHAPTARAVRDGIADADLSCLATAAADALLGAWPDDDEQNTDLVVALRANTDALAGHTADHLWRPDGHLVLFQAGTSLYAAGLTGAAIGYWQRMVSASERLLGSDHTDTLSARGSLASCYWREGRVGEAIELREQVLADRERLLGPDHPDTLTARAHLATSYRYKGRVDEAIKLEERVLADRERLLGPDHPDTIEACGHLAISYSREGHAGEAIELREQVLADRERLLGPDHPDTLTARAHLATSYRYKGRVDEAIELEERVVADRERVLGTDHPDTLTARAHLATSYRYKGRVDEAIELEERVVADRERVLGTDHLDTVDARAELADLYWLDARLMDAAALLKGVVADRDLLLGPDHSDTIATSDDLYVLLDTFSLDGGEE